MKISKLSNWQVLFLLVVFLLGSSSGARAGRLQAEKVIPPRQVTAFDLILAMNTLRVANGLPALIEDPIINAVAQSTAQTMAASQMSGHIGNVSGRLQAAGYGGGAKVWATENFAVGNHSIDEIMVIWSDADHMIPAVNPAYCHVGAGVAESSGGRKYYILQAAYTATNSCGDYVPSTGGSSQSGGTPVAGVSPWIVPVKIATPDADGNVFHVVESGQSFWSIAIAYQVTINDLETWNNLSRDYSLRVGQRLYIPGSNTEGYAKPTAVGSVQIATPDAGGKIVHVVQPYQTLSTISLAYHVTIDSILSLNGLQIDWPLQIDQKLLIPASGLPSGSAPSLTALELLTPAADGRYYHTVKTGETLLGIAAQYKISVAELMAWNGLDTASILYPEQKLLLQVTPPPTRTPTANPPTRTAASTPAAPSIVTPSPLAATPIIVAGKQPGSTDVLVYILLIGLATGGLLLFLVSVRKKS